MSRPNPPTTDVDLTSIPGELERYKRWGLWKPVWRVAKSGKGRWEKVPLLSTNKPEDWLTFDEAVDLWQKGGVGLGFCLTGVENLTAFDLDHCLDERGIPEPWAVDLMRRVGSYTEVTVSGDGLRMFCHGRYERDWVNKSWVSLEVYSGNAGRFVTLTGDVWPGSEETLRTLSEDELDAIAGEYRLASVEGRSAVGDMPDLLDDVEVPDGLNDEARAFLESGAGDDRSEALQWAARCLFEVGLTEAQVLSVLAGNEFAMDVALDHRRQDEDRALAYLWQHHVCAAKGKARPVATEEDFADLVEAEDPRRETLQAEIRRLASLDPVVLAASLKEEAKALHMSVVDLRRFVASERKRRLKAPKAKTVVDYDSPLPRVDDEGRPRNHIENLKEIMRRLGVICRYNVIRKEEELLIPGESFTGDNYSNASFAWLESECSMFNFPTTKIQSFMTYLADNNQYNPALTWIRSKPWDGRSRLAEFYQTVSVSDEYEGMKKAVILRWLLSAIVAITSPDGVQAHGMLVFQGAQGLGKTSWFSRLTPSDMNLSKSGMLLNPGNKDSVTAVNRFWLVELGELDVTFRKADISALKAFTTNNVDTLRVPYARKTSDFRRRTVFFASVNDEEFLHDETGDRRFWVVPVEAVDYQHSIDTQQLWAEVLALHEQGNQHWLSRDEAKSLNGSNARFRSISPIQELVLSELNWKSDKATWRWVTATQVLRDLGINNPTTAQCRDAARALKTVEAVEHKRDGSGRWLLVPYRIGVSVSLVSD